MLNINKEELNRKYNEGNMDYFFEKAREITDFLLSSSYSVKDPEKRADMTQDCLENLWKKILQGKVDGQKNLMSFIWQNSSYRILEIFRKENNRTRIAPMCSYEDICNYIGFDNEGNVYHIQDGCEDEIAV